MGRCVNIGTVSKGVVEASVRKQGKHSVPDITGLLFSLIAPEYDDDPLDTGNMESLFPIARQANVPVVNREEYTCIYTVFDNPIRDRGRRLCSGF